MDKRIKRRRTLLTVVGAIAVLSVALVCVYMLWERAPSVDKDASFLSSALSASAKTDADSGLPLDTRRQDGQHTILLAGSDAGNGNTDTVMVGRLDTKKHTMDFVSIPRDTLIDVSWEIKKINAVYWGAINGGGNGSEALRSHIKKLIGFDVDCYAVIDLSCFIDVIDAMGGVYFDVPRAMDYEDPTQNLSIHLQPGYQLLDGDQAMGLVRFRSGYANADLGRIEMQHAFLKACIEQFITLGNIPNVGKVVSILSENLDTDLSAANIAWLLRQALRCDGEDIHFYTAPNTVTAIGGYSYAVLSKYEWLNLINDCLNPYDMPITEDMLSIATSYVPSAPVQAAQPAPVSEPPAEPTQTADPFPEEADAYAVRPEELEPAGTETGDESADTATVETADGSEAAVVMIAPEE